ncbi:MAG: hypothetical protein WCK63_06425 [Betaproteobacteria bacterium]
MTPEKPPVDNDGVFSRMIATQKKEAREFVADLLRMRGLMPLLMKHRNGGSWSTEEKAELLNQLRILSRVSPYLLFLLLPGSALLLPAYAWWLDRRRGARISSTPPPAHS